MSYKTSPISKLDVTVGQGGGRGVSSCPVCQTQYQPGQVSACATCGWDLTPDLSSLTKQSQIQLAWAQQMWTQLQQQKVPTSGTASSQQFVESGVATSQTAAVHNSFEVELPSECGIDYTYLRHLLADQQWREADEETTRLMLKAAKREKDGYLDLDSIQNFPCTDLHTLDQLWITYSDGRFGFSVQKRIWENLSQEMETVTEQQLGDCLGWRSNGEWLDYDDLSFDHNNSPAGNLPVGFAWWVVWWCISLSRVVVFGVFARLDDCDL